MSVVSHYDADLHAKQRFHDINLEFKVKDWNLIEMYKLRLLYTNPI